MSLVGQIKAELLLNTSSFQRDLNNARDSMGDLNSSARNSQRSLKALETGALALGGAVAAAIGSSVATAAQFEQSLARVAAVSGATETEFAALEETARELGATTTFSAKRKYWPVAWKLAA